MERNQLRKIRQRFSGGSWAIWSDEFPERGCVEEDIERLTVFIEANTHRLNPRVVFLSLNPSAQKPPGYSNFHSPDPRHFDARLKAFIQDNGLSNITGAYMTDIVPHVVEPDSKNVTPEKADTDRLLAQLELLGQTRYTVICFSTQGFDALHALLETDLDSEPHNITMLTGNTGDIRLTAYRVWHYSNYGANAGKVPELESQLQYLNTVIE